MDEDRIPAYHRESFYCPHCGVYALQEWSEMKRLTGSKWQSVEGFEVVQCTATECLKFSIWHDETMVFPLKRQGEKPHSDMPEDVLAIYNEAREVAPISRKSAAGLLRLALQMLVDELEPGRGKIDAKIGALVQKGLAPEVQQAMDVLRVVGNESVHPGEINLDADDDLLPGLFNLVNIIVEQVVARPKHIGGLFSKLPQSKLAAIEKRDAPK